MGLFDNANFDDPKTMGLLAAAAQMFNASAPSTKPTSFGQVFGQGLTGGLNAYQGAIKQRQEDELGKVKIKSLDMAMQKDALEMDKYKADLEKQKRILARLQGIGQTQAQGAAASMPVMQEPITSYAPGGENSPRVGATDWMQSYQSKPQNQPAAQQGTARNASQDLSNGLFERARIYDEEGDTKTALDYYDKAIKFTPKVKNWEKINHSGKVMYAPYYEDGTAGTPVPYEIAEKLEARNTGGKTIFANPYTGKEVTSFANTQSPDSIASTAVTMRGQNMTDARGQESNKLRAQEIEAVQNKPVFSAELGGFVSPKGGLTTIAGVPQKQVKLTEDQGKATSWLVQAENAYKNMMAAGTGGKDEKGNFILKGAASPGFNDALAAIPSFGATGGLANMMRGAERQKFMQGSSSLSEALLRAATGAGVNKDEAAQKIAEITPQIGDSDEVKQQKFNAIPLYIESLKIRAGAGAAPAANIINNSPLKTKVINGKTYVNDGIGWIQQ